jgi:hypothetical protein
MTDELDPRAGGTSPHGLPFPSAADPVAQGAAAIEALARSVDTKVLSGSLDWPTVDISDRGDAWLSLTGAGITGPVGSMQRLVFGDGRAAVAGQDASRWLVLANTNVVSLNANGDWTIYFGVAFAAAPVVVCQNGDTAAVPSCAIGIIATRADGFDIHVTAPGGGPAGAIAIRVNWIALGTI